MALGKLPSEGLDGESEGIFADINITPLTDVFLVLLIIFMATSSVMSQMGVKVNLPQASAKSSEAQPAGVIITLLPGGHVQLDGQAIDLGKQGELQAELTQAFTKTRSKLVILEGDQKAFLGSAVEIMDDARQAGAEHFAIATTAAKSTP